MQKTNALKHHLLYDKHTRKWYPKVIYDVNAKVKGLFAKLNKHLLYAIALNFFVTLTVSMTKFSQNSRPFVGYISTRLCKNTKGFHFHPSQVQCFFLLFSSDNQISFALLLLEKFLIFLHSMTGESIASSS